MDGAAPAGGFGAEPVGGLGADLEDSGSERYEDSRLAIDWRSSQRKRAYPALVADDRHP